MNNDDHDQQQHDDATVNENGKREREEDEEEGPGHPAVAADILGGPSEGAAAPRQENDDEEERNITPPPSKSRRCEEQQQGEGENSERAAADAEAGPHKAAETEEIESHPPSAEEGADHPHPPVSLSSDHPTEPIDLGGLPGGSMAFPADPLAPAAPEPEEELHQEQTGVVVKVEPDMEWQHHQPPAADMAGDQVDDTIMTSPTVATQPIKQEDLLEEEKKVSHNTDQDIMPGEDLLLVMDRSGTNPPNEENEQIQPQATHNSMEAGETSNPGEHQTPVAPQSLEPSDPAPSHSSTHMTGTLPSGLPPGFVDAVMANTTDTEHSNHPGGGNPGGENSQEHWVEEYGWVEAAYVGKVIGKGGETIRDLQARSGARIDVDQNVPQGQARKITYRGTRKTVDFAKQLVAILQQEGTMDTDLPLGDAKREVMVIPATSVGKVIGRGGEMIRELQSRSQGKIQVDHSGSSGLPPDQKQVTITGTEAAVVKAKEMVLFLVNNPMMDAMQSLNMLSEEKSRTGTPWGTGPPYPGLPNQGINMQPGPAAAMYPGAAAAAAAYPHHAGHGGYGAAVAPGMPYPPAQPVHHVPPVHHPQAYPYPQAAAVAYDTYNPYTAQPQVEVMYAQKQFMGRIIGQKGVTINDLQRRSMCDIQINQDVPHGQDCEITIRGTRQGIDMAMQMIREIIEIGPAHPYAGGDYSYGGGGGAGYAAPHQGYAYGQSYGAYPQQQPAAYGQAYGQAYDPSAYGAGAQAYAAAPYGGYGQAAYGAGGPAPGYGSAVVPPTMAASEWKTANTPEGQLYYYNERTGATQWEKPAGYP